MHSDVSANSARIGLVINGEVHEGYGTSYASPIWASVISLVCDDQTRVVRTDHQFLRLTYGSKSDQSTSLGRGQIYSGLHQSGALRASLGNERHHWGIQSRMWD